MRHKFYWLLFTLSLSFLLFWPGRSCATTVKRSIQVTGEMASIPITSEEYRKWYSEFDGQNVQAFPVHHIQPLRDNDWNQGIILRFGEDDVRDQYVILQVYDMYMEGEHRVCGSVLIFLTSRRKPHDVGMWIGEQTQMFQNRGQYRSQVEGFNLQFQQQEQVKTYMHYGRTTSIVPGWGLNWTRSGDDRHRVILSFAPERKIGAEHEDQFRLVCMDIDSVQLMVQR